MSIPRPLQKRSRKTHSAQTQQGFRGFVHVDEAVASGAAPYRQPRELSSIYLDHLALDSSQRDAIAGIYQRHEHFIQKFDAKSEQDQLTASAVLAANLIDFDDLEALQNKWCSRWSKKDGSGERETRRVLYQCSCSYNHTERGSAKRNNPFDSTGCLAHCEILYHTQTHRIILIRGYLDHNEKCRTSPISRSPVWPVHPSVYEDALRRLKAGVSLEEVKKINRELFATHGYDDMPRDITTSRYRWLLHNSDNRSLYRQFHRLRGVKIIQKDYINLHEWLDQDSPQFNRTLFEAIFHYAPRTAHEGRLEVCIATPEMKAAAWKYGHHSQVLLNGTFGISDKKMLLFIVMGIDEKNRGIPLAFLLFSAPGSNQKTAAGYDTDVLTRLLNAWRLAMSSQDNEEFEVWVAITDTDLMERGALLRFHLWQSWKNHRLKVLKGSSSEHHDVRQRLRRLEDLLLESEDFRSARALVTNEKANMIALQDSSECDSAVAEGALKHLEYLDTYWLREALWQSWSKAGRLRAAVFLKRTINEIVPTTNHLESFNGVLKRKHLRRWQNSGRRLRIDILVHILILYALPSIFQQRAVEDMETHRRNTMLKQLPGGSAIMDVHRRTSVPFTPIAYWAVDEERDLGAVSLVTNNQISIPTLDDQSGTYTFMCYSSLAMEHDQNPVTYTISFSGGDTVTCSCPDFQRRGGACKHIRAAVVRAEILRTTQNLRLPVFRSWLPNTEEEAYLVQARRRAAAISISQPSEFSEPSSSSLFEVNLNPITRASLVIDEIVRESLSFSQVVEDSDMDNDNPLDIDARTECTSETGSGYTSPNTIEDDDEDDTLASSVATSDRPAHHGGDFAELERSNQQALNEQTIARTFHDLEVVTPKLVQLSDWLSQAHLDEAADTDIQRAQGLRSSLKTIVGHLDRMLRLHDPGLLGTFRSSYSPPPPSIRLTQRIYPDIMAPPAERRAQKRKESYNVH
ncbi:hypothetical protein BC835DRAFT_1405247 [Cytidiella melzeri]|nr:hypothetical protein BC835DRAFT_1405247 [Cytidiella melzeri]